MAFSVIAGRLSKARAARVCAVSARIVSRRTGRFRAEGREGMQDRASRPGGIPTQTAKSFRPPRSAGFCTAPDCRDCG